MTAASPEIPFLDLVAPYEELRAEIDAAVARVLRSGRYLFGPELAAFESAFARYCGRPHCVAVGSGSDAIELALRALDVGPGDEVIVPSHTFIGTWLAVSATGARPVPVEPDGELYVLTGDTVEAAITPRTAAVLPVHLYGHPADLDAIAAVAGRHGIPVVEDAAQAHGARLRGRAIGSGPSAAAAFSFYPAKNLGSLGDGGAVVTGDPAIADRLRLLRNYGSRVKYVHELAATHSRLDELQAALLRVKLDRLDEWNARRRAIAHRYLRGLAGLDGLVPPRTAEWADPSWHLFVVRARSRAERDRAAAALGAAGIGTVIHYPTPAHRSAVYAADHPAPQPIAEALADQVLSLPIGPHQSSAATDRVVAATLEWHARR
ncbi:DegT/DnrJ/EryC1/StrS family aminotransferase [Allonocardiopsis opalescens]|uniref:dTDP-3-amino-3,4,6-trideoxy-alpha-D-glucose transaminase n=1 Tax=Allonocardiopsis opalescens TaxID=1144618 RepID=A0A2T0Q993_9ACTN|nr:DegT/DnrJ/EryC1/StrS family aminotransferase [Allonocardiopsis opalescens]PRY00456.1 dTDP-3-amino-3,4,6-trideoxy-alpha-D-glucose transaminase [Allonocardiopsis opalescens]